MATISAAGIGSNLDVNGLVTQLMAVERQPLNRLQGRASSFNTDLSEYGRVKSDVEALRSAADALGSTTALDVFKASLSDATAGGVSVGAAASAGEYSIRVVALARAQTLVSPNSTDSGATRITDPGAVFATSADITLRSVAGASFTVAANGLSLNGIRDAINSASGNFGISASVIGDGTGYRLVLRSQDSGTANAVSAIEVANASDSGLDFLTYTAGSSYNATGSTMGQSVAASDASIVVDGVTITSPTNVFASAIQGVTFVAASETASAVTLKIARDTDALVGKAQAFVDAYNGFLTNTAARYAKGGSLAAEGTLLTMMSGFSALITQQGGPSGNAYGYLFQLGISVDKNGKLSLNSATLRQSLADDPGAVAKVLGDGDSGLFVRFRSQAASYVDAGGLIDARQGGIRALTTQLSQRIDTLSARLTLIENRYRAQFASLDALLGRLNQTSAALTRALQ